MHQYHGYTNTPVTLIRHFQLLLKSNQIERILNLFSISSPLKTGRMHVKTSILSKDRKLAIDFIQIRPDSYFQYYHFILFNDIIVDEPNDVFEQKVRKSKPKTMKPAITKKELGSKIDQKTYLNTITSLLNYCRQLEISQSTVFLAKAYLDIIILKVGKVEQSKLSLMMICCVWIAIKFNQSSQISSIFSLEIMHQHGSGYFSINELKSTELLYYHLLSFKLAYTTPYDYIDPFFQSFPWFTSIKKVIPDMIDFSITIPELSCESAENLFYGIFTACLEIKNVQLNSLQQSVLNAQIVSLPVVKRIKQIIVNCYYIALQGDDYLFEEETQPEKMD